MSSDFTASPSQRKTWAWRTLPTWALDKVFMISRTSWRPWTLNMGSLGTGKEHLSLFPCEINFPSNLNNSNPGWLLAAPTRALCQPGCVFVSPTLFLDLSPALDHSGPSWTSLNIFRWKVIPGLSTLFARWSWTRWTQLDLGATLLLLKPSPQLRQWWLIF